MKQATLFLLCVSVSFYSHSQPGDYNGPAKISVNTFWTQSVSMRSSIEKGFLVSARGKVGILERAIATTKTKDPSYSTNSMETELTTLKELCTSKDKELKDVAADKKEKQQNKIKVDELLRSLFGGQVVMQVDDAGLKTIQQRIDDYNKKADELLAMDLSESEEDLENALSDLRGRDGEIREDFKKLEERAKTSAGIGYAEVNYYELLYKQAYWNAAQKIFPKEPGVADTYKEITTIIKGLGSIDDLRKNAEKNRIEKVKNTKMPVASLKDASVEKLFMDAFNARYKDEFKGTAMKAVVTTKDWGIKRNELSGIITGRQREGAVAYKGADGKCYLVSHFNIFQDYVGGSFQGTRSVYVVYKGQEMLCENVK